MNTNDEDFLNHEIKVTKLSSSDGCEISLKEMKEEAKQNDMSKFASEVWIEAFAISAPLISCDGNSISRLIRDYSKRDSIQFKVNAKYDMTDEEKQHFATLKSAEEESIYASELLERVVGEEDDARTRFFTKIEVVKMAEAKFGNPENILAAEIIDELKKHKPINVSESEMLDCLCCQNLLP